MVQGRIAHCIAWLLFSFFACHAASAQPTLPDIAGTYQNKTVVLTWNCQYTGVRGISVLRSADSMSDYHIIGYVTKTTRGIQTYTDNHPAAGKNYYKLGITFTSGLAWRSNYIGVTSRIEPEVAKQQAPRDSLPKPYTERPMPPKMEKESDNLKSRSYICTTVPKGKPSVSISQDTSASVHAPAPPRPRIVISFTGQPETDDPIIMRSRYIYIDSASGHVRMSLPDDVATHHYSVKFYSKQNHVIMEVPKINASQIIFDKRNFQHTGTYKFILRRDYVELESGYVIMNFTPDL